MAGESGESANKVKKRSEKNRAAADSKESLATFSFLCTENTKKAAASKYKLFRLSLRASLHLSLHHRIPSRLGCCPEQLVGGDVVCVCLAPRDNVCLSNHM